MIGDTSPSLLKSLPTIQELFVAGVFLKPLNGKKIISELWSGGGSGGCTSNTTASHHTSGGGGGAYLILETDIKEFRY